MSYCKCFENEFANVLPGFVCSDEKKKKIRIGSRPDGGVDADEGTVRPEIRGLVLRGDLDGRLPPHRRSEAVGRRSRTLGHRRPSPLTRNFLFHEFFNHFNHFFFNQFCLG